MFTKPNQNSGVPIYVQIKEQIIHAIERGAIKRGEQLPSVRVFAEQLVVNPNTVIKIYRELEIEGIIEIKHGSGAFVSKNYKIGTKANLVNRGVDLIEKLVGQLINKGLTKEEIKRMVEAALHNYK
ncbi:MAG TPA: GntR family transcriptional regulator [Flavisolibacter sp.]|nr:GntR family transcriptional regulator [Flavisolibacter sp.]